jgi:hypothetical protein
MELKTSQCVMQWLLFVEREGEVSSQVHHVEISGLKGCGETFSDASPTFFTIHSMRWSKRAP